MFRIRVDLLLGCLLVMSSAWANTYRWQDADGHVHFGDSLPVGIKAEVLTIHKSGVRMSPEEAKQQLNRLRHTEAAKNADQAAAKAKATAAADVAARTSAAQRERCDRARWALAALETERPVYRDEQGLYRVKRPPTEADVYTGQRDYLDTTTRADAIARYQREVKTSCATVPDAADKQRADDELRMAEHCQTAYAELQALTLPESRAAPNEIAARQAYITDNCGPAKQR